LESAESYEAEGPSSHSKVDPTTCDATCPYIMMRDGSTLAFDDKRLLSKAAPYVKALKTARSL